MAFQIENGVLLKYTKEPGVMEVEIPARVTQVDSSSSRFELKEEIVKSIGISKYPLTSMGSLQFSRGPFEGCSNITSVSIPDTVTLIGISAFEGCTNLACVTLSDSVTSIANGAFGGCTTLKSFTIPKGITSIGKQSFHRCTGLAEFIVAENNPIYSSSEGVLFNKDKTTLIRYPIGKTGAYTIPNGVTHIADSAFSDCTGLTSITIPNGVTHIADSAFGGCTKLTSITIPGSVTSIGDWVFNDCTGLTEFIVTVDNPKYSSSDGVLFNKDKSQLIRYICGKSSVYTLPDSVTQLNSCAFTTCPGLKSVIISDNISTLKSCTFNYCRELTDIFVSDHVSDIEDEAIRGCNVLTNISVNADTYFTSCSFDECISLKTISIRH